MSDGDNKNTEDSKLLYCSFCGKSQHEVRKLIAGPSVFICDECVDLCNDIIQEEMQEKAASAAGELLKPQEIRDTLDQYVICLLYTSPSPRDATLSRMPSSA